MLLTQAARSVLSSGPVAAGTTNVVGTAVDRTGFEKVRFTAVLADVTATCVLSLKAQGGNASDGSDAVDLPACVTPAFTADATSADNKLITLDVIKPVGVKYVRPVLLRGTANAAVSAILADLYEPRTVPATGGDVIATARGQG